MVRLTGSTDAIGAVGLDFSSGFGATLASVEGVSRGKNMSSAGEGGGSTADTLEVAVLAARGSDAAAGIATSIDAAGDFADRVDAKNCSGMVCIVTPAGSFGGSGGAAVLDGDCFLSQDIMLRRRDEFPWCYNPVVRGTSKSFPRPFGS